MDIPSNEENVDHLLEKFVIYRTQVFELSKKLQWLQALKKVEEEKVLNLHTDFKKRETSIYELESNISQNNVDIKELKQLVSNCHIPQFCKIM